MVQTEELPHSPAACLVPLLWLSDGQIVGYYRAEAELSRLFGLLAGFLHLKVFVFRRSKRYF